MLFLLLLFLSFNVFAGDSVDDTQDEAFKYGTYNAQMQRADDEESSNSIGSGVSNLPMRHIKYNPPQQPKEVKILDYDEYNPKHQQATKDELARLRQHYRHVELKQKFPQLSYFAMKYIYALPTVVQNYQSKISGSTVLQNAAIDVFNTISQPNGNQLLLDQRSFGLGVSYGKRLSARTQSEWEILFYQKSFIHTDNSTDGITVSYDYVDSTGATQTVTSKYNNVEYIQRNIALTYSRHLEFLSFFGDSSSDKIRRFVPYLTLGGGAISRWNFLRFSAGTLGTTNATAGDLTTNADMFNFMPAFVFGGGMKFRISDAMYFDGQFKSVQPVNDINFQNYIATIGVRIYF